MSTIKATRACTLCGVLESDSEFEPRYSQCRTCFAKKQKKWNSAYYAKNREKIIETNKQYMEKNKETIAERKSRYYKKNHERLSAQKKTYYQNNKEKFLEARRIYVKKNKELIAQKRKEYYATDHGKKVIDSCRIRRRKNSGKIFNVTDKDLQRIRSNGCVVCGNSKVTIDHIIPIIKGGNHSIGNLQGLCKSHNSSKGSKFMMEWRVFLSKNELKECAI